MSSENLVPISVGLFLINIFLLYRFSLQSCYKVPRSSVVISIWSQIWYLILRHFVLRDFEYLDPRHFGLMLGR